MRVAKAIMIRLARTWTVAVLAAIAVAGSTALATAQRHPNFDDGGTLAWHNKFDLAKDAARKTSKLIFVEVGTKT